VLAHAAALAEYTRDKPVGWATLVVQWAETLAPVRGRPVDPSRVRSVLTTAEQMGFALLAPRLRAALA
jgi:hypothetical protein